LAPISIPSAGEPAQLPDPGAPTQRDIDILGSAGRFFVESELEITSSELDVVHYRGLLEKAWDEVIFALDINQKDFGIFQDSLLLSQHDL
jgi:hypothetical protein